MSIALTPTSVLLLQPVLERNRPNEATVAVGSYITGQRVPASGIYEVRHQEHRVPPEVTLLKGQHFPPCAQCGTAVQFKIVRVVAAIDKMREKIILHVLPVIDEGEQAA